MRSTYLVSVLVLLLFAPYGIRSQSPGPQVKQQIPGNIQLPKAYKYERRRGIDSLVRAFIRNDGFEITHDIGRMAGDYSGAYLGLRKNEMLWNREQIVNGENMRVVYTKDRTLIASFPKLNVNFHAQVDSPDEIADFLLIVMTYRSDHQPLE